MTSARWALIGVTCDATCSVGSREGACFAESAAEFRGFLSSLPAVPEGPSPPTGSSARREIQGVWLLRPQTLAHTFFLLLDIMTFFDHYHSKREEQALEVWYNSVCVCVCVGVCACVCVCAEWHAAI